MLVWEGEVYGWRNELRDPASERPGAYAVDKAGLVFKAAIYPKFIKDNDKSPQALNVMDSKE